MMHGAVFDAITMLTVENLIVFIIRVHEMPKLDWYIDTNIRNISETRSKFLLLVGE